MFVAVNCRKKLLLYIALFCLFALLAGGFGIHKATASVQADAQPESGVELPIIMYHGILKDEKRQGKYVISPDLLESDMKYLKEAGYTPVFMRDLIAYTTDGTPLPEKPIMLSFDDGYYNNYAYAFPLAKQYQMKLVLAPIIQGTEKYSEANEENPNYGHITWNNMKEMVDSGYVEIQNHSYNLHSSSQGRVGIQRAWGESEKHYETLLTQDLQMAQTKITEYTGVAPTTFVYPFGAFSDTSEEYIRKLGFLATLTCEGRMNFITQNPECLYGLGRYLRSNETDSATFFQKILP